MYVCDPMKLCRYRNNAGHHSIAVLSQNETIDGLGYCTARTMTAAGLGCMYSGSVCGHGLQHQHIPSVPSTTASQTKHGFTVWCICRVKSVWSIPERFWNEVLTKRRYTNVRPLLFYLSSREWINGTRNQKHHLLRGAAIPAELWIIYRVRLKNVPRQKLRFLKNRSVNLHAIFTHCKEGICTYLDNMWGYLV